jgi:hypothetical protein
MKLEAVGVKKWKGRPASVDGMVTAKFFAIGLILLLQK